MSNEIRLAFNNAVANGAYIGAPLAINITDDQAAIGAVEGVQPIGTSEETLLPGGLTNKGWLFMMNLDDTNFIRFGFSTGVYGGLINPGKIAQFCTVAAATIYLIADTAECKLQYRWLEA